MKDDDEFRVVVAKNVTRFREKARMSRKDLSEKIGGSHSYVYHVEEGKKMPSLLMGMRIAKALGIQPDRLLEA